MSPQPRGALSDPICHGAQRNGRDKRGARSAVGVTAMPFGIPVEIEAVVQIGR